MICELSNEILVYTYDGNGKSPQFELIQTVSTVMDAAEGACAASGLRISPSGKYLYCSTAGDNSAGVFRINPDTGMLDQLFILPISGKYPKDVAVFPDERTLVVLNHESNDITFFRIDYEKKIMTMHGKPIKIETPNCIFDLKSGGPGVRNEEKNLTEKVGSCKIKSCGINPFNGVNKNLHYTL